MKSDTRTSTVPVRLYYTLRPFIPRRIVVSMRSHLARQQRWHARQCWPINPDAAGAPPHWRGWPGGKRFALILTHDVETARGVRNCRSLMDLIQARGLKASFNFVPERYYVPTQLRSDLTTLGFEIGVHGLRHDGRLYANRAEFTKRAARINAYLHNWQCSGFRSPSMQHDLEWLHDLNIAYDASTFDSDPFQPQPSGVTRIFPYWVSDGDGHRGYVELPCTLPQDFTVFILLRERGTELWRRKLDWIAEQGGMALLITHPDYMAFNTRAGPEQYAARHYAEFLDDVHERYGNQFWNPLPRELAAFCRPASNGPNVACAASPHIAGGGPSS